MIGACLLIQTLLELQQGEKYHTHSSLLISFSRMKKIWTTVDWSEVISELKAPKITHIKCCIHANFRKTNRKLCSITKWIYNYGSLLLTIWNVNADLILASLISSFNTLSPLCCSPKHYASLHLCSITISSSSGWRMHRGPSIVSIMKRREGFGSILTVSDSCDTCSFFIWALFHQSPLCIFDQINLCPVYNCLFHRSFIGLIYLTQLNMLQKDILLPKQCLCC